jgi:selenocysteine lyase/cysteine desulfurase
MAIHGVKQLIKWTPSGIQEYCDRISGPSFGLLQERGFQLAPRDQRAHHLVGIRLQTGVKLEAVKHVLDANQFILSYRGNSIRVSPNIYNTESEMAELADTMIDAINQNN